MKTSFLNKQKKEEVEAFAAHNKLLTLMIKLNRDMKRKLLLYYKKKTSFFTFFCIICILFFIVFGVFYF